MFTAPKTAYFLRLDKVYLSASVNIDLKQIRGHMDMYVSKVEGERNQDFRYKYVYVQSIFAERLWISYSSKKWPNYENRF